jgi:hypothetical protein
MCEDLSMMMIKLLPLAAALVAAAPPTSQPNPAPEEARIPFVNFRSIYTFHPVSDEIVYLQDVHRAWYRATLYTPCFNIRGAFRIAVDTRFGDTLDNNSSFLVGGERCPIQSLVRSGPPPSRHRPAN